MTTKQPATPLPWTLEQSRLDMSARIAELPRYEDPHYFDAAYRYQTRRQSNEIV